MNIRVSMASIGVAMVISSSLLVGCSGGGEAKAVDVTAAWRAYDSQRRESGDYKGFDVAQLGSETASAGADVAEAVVDEASEAAQPEVAADALGDSKPAADAPKVMPVAGNVVDAATIEATGGVDAAFSVEEISDEVFARMKGKSFKDDCTVPREDLRYLRMLHVDAEGRTLVGEMVVASSVADEVLDIFRQLYDAKWPIKKMVLVDEYDASDEASCADGNTAAFNFRPVSGGTELSNHAFGLAIDINTFENPYCIPEQDYVFPPEAARFADRSLEESYMIHEGDLCWRLFTERGWSWGGAWSSPKDYQHFEKV